MQVVYITSTTRVECHPPKCSAFLHISYKIWMYFHFCRAWPSVTINSIWEARSIISLVGTISLAPNPFELRLYSLSNLGIFYAWLWEIHVEWPMPDWGPGLREFRLLLYIIVQLLMEWMVQRETIIIGSVPWVSWWSWAFSFTKMWQRFIVHYLHSGHKLAFIKSLVCKRESSWKQWCNTFFFSFFPSLNIARR